MNESLNLQQQFNDFVGKYSKENSYNSDFYEALFTEEVYSVEKRIHNKEVRITVILGKPTPSTDESIYVIIHVPSLAVATFGYVHDSEEFFKIQKIHSSTSNSEIDENEITYENETQKLLYMTMNEQNNYDICFSIPSIINKEDVLERVSNGLTPYDGLIAYFNSYQPGLN